MARILRGDIVWADLNPVKGHEQAGLRPALILSPEIFNDRSGTVIAMALTSQPQRAGFPLTMEITSVSLPKPTWVKISQIRTLSIERLGKRMGHVSDAEMSQIVEGLNEIIGEQTNSAYRR
jgi:mRNA interferase MazF